MTPIRRLRGSPPVHRPLLDHRVGEQFARDPLQGLGVHIVIDVELEMFALPHVAHPVHAQPGQRAQDRLTLRIEDLRFHNDVDDHARHGGEATGIRR